MLTVLNPTAPQIVPAHDAADRLRSAISTFSLGLALLLLAGTYLWISPPPEQTYPGAIPWRPGSLLAPLVEAMSLWGAVATVRGVEVKDLALYTAAGLGALALAARAAVSVRRPEPRRTALGAWFLGQCFLGAWVAISAASASWSGDPWLSAGQAAIYALGLTWAVSLAWTLESRDVPRLLAGYVVIAALGAVLCVWYYLERNPYHRPGFPLGNPSVLAACCLPAFMLAVSTLTGGAAAWATPRERLPRPVILASAAAALALGGCLILTGSRAALLALVVAGGCILLLLVNARLRWMLLLGGLLLGAAAPWLFSSSINDVVMARGATIRFRIYAWRYAAQLWALRTISGHGAGAYPRLAGPLSLDDRILDPAAFMGENVEHAHNELFEVFVEIGLLGGVTFVGGLVATAAAALALLRANLSLRRRWLLIGLIAGLVGLLTDAMFGVGLRLPGVPAVFYTLLGTIWAVSRSVSREDRPALVLRPRSQVARPLVLAAAAVLAAGGALTAAGLNWSGVLHEQAAERLLREGRFAEARPHAALAAQRLLEPFRRLVARQRLLECIYGQARQAVYSLTPASPSDRTQGQTEAHTPSDDRVGGEPQARPSYAPGSREEAIRVAHEAFELALELDRRAPAFGRFTLTAALSAELLAELYAPLDLGRFREWSQRAWRMWRIRYNQRPYEAETILALLRYPVPAVERVGLLRDALRAGFPSPRWYAAAREAARDPQFEPTLAAFVQSVGPYDPRTDLDVLILSRAPEIYRLQAFRLAERGHYSAAAAAAARAARLYKPMQARLPELYSVALAEQAEYVLLDQPGHPERAVELAEQALNSLPAIQHHKREELARPFRLRLARCLLAAGKELETREVLRSVHPDAEQIAAAMADLYVDLVQSFARRSVETRPPVAGWIEAALRLRADHVRAWGWKAWLAAEEGPVAVRSELQAAAAAGVGEADLARIRRSLCEEFPPLCEALGP
jgi:O-antigen ligase